MIIIYELIVHCPTLHSDIAFVGGTTANILRSRADGMHPATAHIDDYWELSGVDKQARTCLQQSSDSGSGKPVNYPPQRHL